MKLPKIYEPKEYETDVYALWEKSDAFVPKNRGNNDNYCIVLPPPNANGDLHVGHCLMFAIQDILSRYHRMNGKAVLWLPGADHAGFETQAVYEKHLAKEGKSRFDYSREELYAQIWNFVEENRDNYQKQFRRLGASVDWSRFVYTLDDKIIKQAYATFKKMWDKGLIYRGNRLVNFCTFHGTSFADIEVTYKEVQGSLWHIKYPLTDGSGSITVATTRPETMLGDTAVAVHPRDKRYTSLHGKTIKLPLTKREIPIVADDFVDRKYGSGAVKITPAHDPNDYEIADRHDLPMITVISHEGTMTHEVPELYQGLKVEEARKAIVKDLENLGLLEKTEKNSHSVGHCYKCGTVIEPLLKEQWFVDMKPLATVAIRSLRGNQIKFYPDSKREQLNEYLNGLRDWNISRQIAWGIPIPAFQNMDNPDDWIYSHKVDQEEIKQNGKTYRRDPDVLDTWFSSSSWPYATLDNPDGDDFKRFYPNSLMETGGEILYPWVSRMVMLGLFETGKIPFEDVYIHGYVLAEDGSKMSKSVGNVIDPVAIIDEYGSDALRMGLIAGRAAGVNRGFDRRRVQEARNFANKLWNIARYIEGKTDGLTESSKAKSKNVADHWILSRLQHSVEEISKYINQYRLSEAYENLYHFIWDDLADWYIEASKVAPNPFLMHSCLMQTLALAHPFAPFVTETIWQTLRPEEDTLLITSKWPKPQKFDAKQAKVFENIKTIVSEIRLIRTTLKLPNTQTLYHSGEEFLTTYGDVIKALAGVKAVVAVSDGAGLNLTRTNFKCWLDLDQNTQKRYQAEIVKKRTIIENRIKLLDERLANKSYTQNAPKDLVAQTKTELKEAKAQLQKI